jgi:hypothetical protein
MGHTKGRPHTGGIGEGKETKNLNVYCTGANIVTLNWPRPPWEGDHEVVKRSGRDEPI